MRPISLFTFAFAVTLVANAAMAAANDVNIADPTVTGREAKVDLGNRLAVEEVAPASADKLKPALISATTGSWMIFICNIVSPRLI